MGSKGGESVFFKADESKETEAAETEAVETEAVETEAVETEAVEYAENVLGGISNIAGAVAKATSAVVEAAQRGMMPAAPEQLATVEETDDGDEEEGGKRSATTRADTLDRAGSSADKPSPVKNADSSSLRSQLLDKIDTIRGDEGDKDAGERERSGVQEEQRGVARQGAPAVAVADGIGPRESLRSTETVAGNVAATATPIVSPRRRAGELVRPPPIVTEDIPPILHTSVYKKMGRGGSSDSGDADEDLGQVRRCFVAKTFSPSDLGLGELRRGGDNEGGDAVPEEMTKASLMKDRRRRRTIHKGIPGIEGRRHTVDEVLGLDDPQAVLGSVPPERLFSMTGMFHPEAPVKVRYTYVNVDSARVLRTNISSTKGEGSSYPPSAVPVGSSVQNI